jgi:hypothetical protein
MEPNLVPSTDALAVVSCVECGAEPVSGENWRLYFADLAEVAIYCPECAGREFPED